MKIYLIVSILFLFTLRPGAQELIQDCEFDEADLSRPYVGAANVPGLSGVWVSHNQEDFQVTHYSIVTDSKAPERGNILEIKNNSKLSTWYKSLVSQRIEAIADPAVYRLGFWAKSPDGGEVRAFIRTTGVNGKDQQRFFITTKNQPRKPSGTYEGSLVKVIPSGKWKYYTFDFDFSKTNENFYQWELRTAQESNDVDLENFSVNFQNSAGHPSTIYIDGVSLTRVNDEQK